MANNKITNIKIGDTTYDISLKETIDLSIHSLITKTISASSISGCYNIDVSGSIKADNVQTDLVSSKSSDLVLKAYNGVSSITITPSASLTFRQGSTVFKLPSLSTLSSEETIALKTDIPTNILTKDNISLNTTSTYITGVSTDTSYQSFKGSNLKTSFASDWNGGKNMYYATVTLSATGESANLPYVGDLWIRTASGNIYFLFCFSYSTSGGGSSKITTSKCYLLSSDSNVNTGDFQTTYAHYWTKFLSRQGTQALTGATLSFN